MTRAAKLINLLTLGPTDLTPYYEVADGKEGWSKDYHYLFFKHLVGSGAKTILVCGVYRGLDLALIQRAAKECGVEVELTGIDLFSPEPCADWNEAQKAAGSWNAAVSGPPPDMSAALRCAPGATLIKGDSASVMADMLIGGRTFDAIYLDTSHDEATVRGEIQVALGLLAPFGILCGDDYRDDQPEERGWGVDKAVRDLIPHHVVMFNRIWLAT